MDKENEVSIYNRILFSFKKREIVLFVTTWMKLEDIRPGELFVMTSDF